MAALWPAFDALKTATETQFIRTRELDAATSRDVAPAFIATLEHSVLDAIAAAILRRNELLASPSAGPRDVALKLIAIIATGQPGPGSPEFPWTVLTALLHDLIDL